MPLWTPQLLKMTLPPVSINALQSGDYITTMTFHRRLNLISLTKYPYTLALTYVGFSVISTETQELSELTVWMPQPIHLNHSFQHQLTISLKDLQKLQKRPTMICSRRKMQQTHQPLRQTTFLPQAMTVAPKNHHQPTMICSWMKAHHVHQYLQEKKILPQTIDWRDLMAIREFFGSAPFLVNNVTRKSSEGQHRRQHTYRSSTNMGRKKGRKRKKKKTNHGGSNQQQQQ